MTADPPPQVRSIGPQRRVGRDQPPPAVNGGLPNHLGTQVRTAALVVWSHFPGAPRPPGRPPDGRTSIPSTRGAHHSVMHGRAVGDGAGPSCFSMPPIGSPGRPSRIANGRPALSRSRNGNLTDPDRRIVARPADAVVTSSDHGEGETADLLPHMPQVGPRLEDMVFIAGFGCAAGFLCYMNRVQGRGYEFRDGRANRDRHRAYGFGRSAEPAGPGTAGTWIVR